jgi:hypothetical protein
VRLPYSWLYKGSVEPLRLVFLCAYWEGAVVGLLVPYRGLCY